ncbi:hypothetical protein AB9P05_06370 [Roseivirga sp. BDSF3-8]|uniref:hypothetical protein n=1 Tax=Roseivirga sp. BDSF3-8 TaxID=3241598 RepID=UPI003531931F
MEMDTANALSIWNQWGQITSFVVFGLAALVLLAYVIRLAVQPNPKAKYDFINRNEISNLWYASILLIIGAAVYANTLIDESGTIWFFVRIFVSVMLGLIIGVIISNMLRFYYPFYIEKRLKRLRYQPRLSPKSGKPMKLLSEDEEDVYLDEGMQAEENIYSIDYDVWIDEENNYTQIEKYAGHLHALKCPECNYQTLKVTREEILQAPSVQDEGELIKYYKCGYCSHKVKRSFRVARLTEPRNIVPSKNPTLSMS